MKLKVEALIKLDETRREVSSKNAKLQMKVKNLYDKRTVGISFQTDDLVPMWNARI